MTSHPFGDNLLLLEKPGRYLGNEFNAVRKPISDKLIRVALLYPETYEIGMSNLGLKIIYHLFNSFENVYAERAFLPWIDAVEFMRQNRIPLFTLETYTPLKEFDLVGVSLHTELNYTNFLLALDLAQIPLRREERLNRSDLPLILVGGPSTFNPLPLEPFADFFAVGEGENIVKALVPILGDLKLGRLNKTEFWKEASKIEGIYVPGISNTVKRAVAFFDERDFPIDQIVPNVEIVHNRYVIEVMRGCTRGCRFCEGGFIYRPLRVRQPYEVLKIAQEGVKRTGFDEIGLLAFSISDYPYLVDVIRALKRTLQDVHLSLPSLPVNALKEDLLMEFQDLRRFGITLAPETASQRLREVINKNVELSEIYSSLEIAQRFNFRHVKLYMMVGLPTETESDLNEMIHFLKRLSSEFRRITFRVSISPFVPRPHTPFQYFSQEDFESIEDKFRILKSSLKGLRNVELSFHDPKMSLIEGIFGRGDGILSHVLLRAYQEGAMFDSRSEFFNFDIYLKAFEELGIDYHAYLRERDLNSKLPWDFIDTGVFKPYLRKEYERSKIPKFTPDCARSGCQGCGRWLSEDYEICREGLKDTGEAASLKVEAPHKANGVLSGYLLTYKIKDNARFLSQRDLVRVILNLLRISGVNLAYSKGFVPKPRISMPNPLPLGVESEVEFFFFESESEIDEGELLRKLNEKGKSVLEFVTISKVFKKPDWSKLQKCVFEIEAGERKEEFEVDLSKTSLYKVLEEKYRIDKKELYKVKLKKKAVVF